MHNSFLSVHHCKCTDSFSAIYDDIKKTYFIQKIIQEISSVSNLCNELVYLADCLLKIVDVLNFVIRIK